MAMALSEGPAIFVRLTRYQSHSGYQLLPSACSVLSDTTQTMTSHTPRGGPLKDKPALNGVHATPLAFSISPQVPQLSQDVAP